MSSRVAARQVAELLVGFANAEGGMLAIGIHNGVVEGVARSGARVNEWRQVALDFTEPPVRHRFELVSCTNRDGVPDEIAVIEIESSERVHTDAKGDTYLRVGDENRRLGVMQAQELRYDKGDSAFDGMPAPGAKLSDLDQGLVDRYCKKIRTGEPELALRARGLLCTGDDAVLRPTVAGLLLFGKAPQQAFPEAIVRILRYRGSSRETGTRANVISDRRVEGSLITQIEGARRLLRRSLPPVVRLEQKGRFVSSTLIPPFVWLEALVNAVTHRSYSIGGDHVRVELFDDRVEVESPGRLPGLVRLDNIRSTRFARNPRVARALSDLGYVRELGEGVNRMFEEMQRAKAAR